MQEDPIVKKVRQARLEIEQECGEDFQKLYERALEVQKKFADQEQETEATHVFEWLAVSSPSLKEVWDNEEDAVYDSDRSFSADEPINTGTEVRVRGLCALVDALGTVEAERFITLLLREPFAYTTWQRQFWADKSVAGISNAAMELRNGSRV